MSVTARLNRLKDLRVVAADALRIGTETAERAVRAASPHVSAVAGAVRARLGWGEAPAPSAPAAPPTPAKPVEAPATGSRKAGPSPATVARNIAPHPPEPAAQARRSAPKASPSGKLPPRRRSDDD